MYYNRWGFDIAILGMSRNNLAANSDDLQRDSPYNDDFRGPFKPWYPIRVAGMNREQWISVKRKLKYMRQCCRTAFHFSDISLILYYIGTGQVEQFLKHFATSFTTATRGNWIGVQVGKPRFKIEVEVCSGNGSKPDHVLIKLLESIERNGARGDATRDTNRLYSAYI